MEVISGLDIATNMDAETAATQLAQFANIMDMSHDESKNFGSTIVELGNNFATTEADISNMAMRIAGAGKQIGMSEADVLGLATALSSMGINAEAGGTAISTIMANIDKEVATNGKNLETWAQTANMSVDDFTKAWGDNAVDALSKVLIGMDKATEQGDNMSVILDELGITSIRQTDTFKRLASNSEFLGDAVEKANNAWEDNTALDKEVENRNNSMAAQLEILMNKVKAVAIEVGEPLMKALIGVIDAADPLIDAIASGANAFADLDDNGKKMVIMAVGIVAAFGPVSSIFGKMLGTAGKLSDGWKKISDNLGVVKKNIKNTAAEAAQGTTVWTKYAAVGDRANKNFVKWNKSTQSYVKTNSKLRASVATSTAGIKAQAAAQTASNVAMKTGSVVARTFSAALKTIAPVVAITALVEIFMAVSTAIEDARKKAEDYEASTKGLEDAATRVNLAVSGEAESFDDLEDAIESIDMQKVMDEHKQLAETIKETAQTAQTSVSLLDDYADTIGDLLGKNLDDEQAAEFKMAVEGLNDEIGTNFEVVKDAGGAYQVMADGVAVAKDEILKLISAQQTQIQLDATKESEKSAYSQLQSDLEKQAEAYAALEDATKKNEEAQAALNREKESGLPISEASLQQAADAENVMKDAQQTYNEMTAEVDSSQSAYNRLTEQHKLLAMAAAEGADAFIKAAAANNNYQIGVQSAGVNLIDFTKSLKDMGYTAEEISGLSSEQAYKMAQGWKDGTQGLIDAATEAGVKVPDKLRQMGDEAKESGKETADKYASGISEEGQAAIDAALEVTGMTRDQFAALADDAGIEGEEATIAFADSIASLAPDANTAASGVSQEAKTGFGSADTITPGQNLVGKMISGMEKKRSDVVNESTSLSGAAAGKMDSKKGEAGTAGGNLVAGLWNGISDKATWAINQIGGFAGQIIEKVKSVFGIASPSKVMRDEVGKNLALGVAVGIEKNAKYAKKSAAEMGSAVVSAASKRLSQYKKANNMTIAQEIEFWREVRKHTKKGTDAYIEATARIGEAKKKQNDQIKKQNDKRQKQVKKDNETLLKAEKTFVDKVKKINEQLIKDVQEAKDAYAEAVQSRTDTILSGFSLFDRYTTKSIISGEKLIENMQSQVDATKAYEEGMQRLEQRIGKGDLYNEIADMGVDGLRYIQSLNNMTDEQIAEFVRLYNERGATAKREATRQSEDLLKETNDTIKKLNEQAAKDVKAAANELKKTASELGTSTAKAVAKMAKNIKVSANDIAKSINKAISSINKLDKRASYSKVSTKTNTAQKVKAQSLNEGVPVPAVYNGRAAVISDTGAIEGYSLGPADYESVASRQTEASILKGMTALTMALKDNRMAGGDTTNNQTLNFYSPIETPDQVARTMRMQQFYGLAGRY